ncbi:fructosamine kinase family protein [Flagellimonas meridianipacifica]|uniref:fructosamine kinase family protein n=1 Tax=Flagellimonas meridianipacifica TaxID=1080225 RepID=UPI0013048EB7|nr:fructosamine kinase family protein [Allomuricauda pacifica]
MRPELKSHLETVLGSPIKGSKSVSGGDIANAYVIEIASNRFFLKTSSKPWAEQLFISESRNLKQLEATHTIKVPKVYAEGIFDQTGYLILEFIESKTPNSSDFERLGHELAELHLVPQPDVFGFQFDNYIGHLSQNNTIEKDWSVFYVQHRIIPQIQMAKEKGLFSKGDIPPRENLEKTCTSLIGQVKPAILHGDLWGGNFLIAKDGTPVLIDPSTYIGHSEVDLAMSRLFGGFGPSFYSAYHKLILPHPKQKELTELYQLYYLLVHLNLFGSSYRTSVLATINKYFR